MRFVSFARLNKHSARALTLVFLEVMIVRTWWKERIERFVVEGRRVNEKRKMRGLEENPRILEHKTTWVRTVLA